MYCLTLPTVMRLATDLGIPNDFLKNMYLYLHIVWHNKIVFEKIGAYMAQLGEVLLCLFSLLPKNLVDRTQVKQLCLQFIWIVTWERGQSEKYSYRNYRGKNLIHCFN